MHSNPKASPSLLTLVLLLTGCSGETTCADDCAPKTFISMDFTRAGGFYAEPFPNDARLGADGRIELSDFPNAQGVDLVKRVLAILGDGAPGFGATSGIFFQVSGPIRASDLPSVHASVRA